MKYHAIKIGNGIFIKASIEKQFISQRELDLVEDCLKEFGYIQEFLKVVKFQWGESKSEIDVFTNSVNCKFIYMQQEYCIISPTAEQEKQLEDFGIEVKDSLE